MKKITFIITALFFILKCDAQKLLVNGFRHTSPPVTYTTLNASFIEPGLILSNGNLTLTGDGATYGITRSVDSIYQDTYCEITVGTASAFTYVGLVTPSASRGDAVGVDAYGWGFRADGFYVNNFSFNGYGSDCTAGGTVIGLSYNKSTGELTMLKNNTSMTVMATLNPALSYYVAIGYRGSSDAVTVNFGATPFVYSGHYTGLYH